MVKFLLLIIYTLTSPTVSRPAFGADSRPPGHYEAQARAKFQLQKYDEAIQLFNKHLKRNPKDYESWSLLGAAYYHTGQPRKALRYLKHVEKKTTEKSYNYYYQGLAYAAAGYSDRSRDYWVYAASKYSDDYAARATFELAFLEYKAKVTAKAEYWLSRYLQSFPQGPYATQAARMLQAVREGRWTTSFDPPKRPNLEEALFKYSKLSLGPKPHFWYLQGGMRYTLRTGNEPEEVGKLRSTTIDEQAGIANAAIGIGPIKYNDLSAFAGYSYRQLWYTDSDRMETYSRDLLDFTYFPLRADLLERKHQIYADLRRDVADTFYFGLFTRFEISRMGSSFFPSPEDEDLRKVIPISETQLFLPWIGASYLENMRTLGYLYFRKEINSDTAEFSNKTYDLDQTAFSFGLSHEMDFPEQSLAFSAEIFQYEFIYNDRWLDYKRLGGFFSVDHEFIPRWFINGLLGIYNDTYIQGRFREGGCTDALPSISGSSPIPSGDPSVQTFKCTRKDSGLMFQGMVYWNWTQFQRFSVNVLQVSNKNSKQKEFEESALHFQATYTLAFPSVKRISRFVDRFADTAFTKRAE